MRKLLVIFVSLTLISSLFCSCDRKNVTNDGDSGTEQYGKQDNGQAEKSNEANGTAQSDGHGTEPDSRETGKVIEQETGQYTVTQKNTAENNNSESGVLHSLYNTYNDSACITENGYYYLTHESVELKDGKFGIHLMYMDFAAKREIYLCSTAGCKHDSADCPSVFLISDFPQASTKLFVFNDNLYILSREYDDDGTVSQFIGGEENIPESKPVALYCAKLDGTERKKVYTFDAELTIEDMIFANNDGIYIVTKKVSADKTGGQTYKTSSERKLVFLDLSSLSAKDICPMAFGDSISWNIIGCCQYGFVLSGIDYGREISRDELWNDDLYSELYQNSAVVYALLDPQNGKLKEICRQSNKNANSAQIFGDSLYLSSDENKNIDVINIGTGEKKTLCSIQQNLIMGVLGDMLCCREWNLAENPKWYFVDTNTGEMTKTDLVNKCNGWSLEFRGETSEDVLFVYDYDASTTDNESYEIYQYKHALISKKDLFAGRQNYRKIDMTGPGQ